MDVLQAYVRDADCSGIMRGRGCCERLQLPGRRALDRLARFYIRRCRRKLVRQNRFVEAAARWALMGAALR
jgi:hypothetical protein